MLVPDPASELASRIESAKMESFEEAACYLEKENVQLIKEVMPFNFYEGIFMSHTAELTYEVFL